MSYRALSATAVGVAAAALGTLVACSSTPAADAPVADGGIDATQPTDAGVVTPAADAGIVNDGDSTAIDAGDGATPTGPGFRADYFEGFYDLALTRVETDTSFTDRAASPGPGVSKDRYSVRWTATFEAAAEALYHFKTVSDDGARVYVDDVRVIDDWAIHGAKETTGQAPITKGVHTLRVEYFQYNYAATFALTWAAGDDALAPIPAARLTPLPSAPVDGTGKKLPGPVPTFVNPVVPFDCPDPGVLRVDGTLPSFVMVCTGGKLLVRTSDDLVTWADTTSSILPAGKAPWSINGNRNWAPEIHKVGAGYVAYFTAADGQDHLAIGAASAPSPTGPFTVTAAPLVTNTTGVIDATYFEDDDGTKYLYWKLDGNSVGQATPIYVQKLAADGLSFAPSTSPVEVLRNDSGTWEGGVVEAPWVVKRNGQYFMFYSGNVYDDRYRTGVARAASPTGPFTKKGAPILTNNGSWVGPGHGSVVVSHGADWYFFHAWPALPNGKNDTSKGRNGVLAPIVWANGWPEITGGTTPVGTLNFP